MNDPKAWGSKAFIKEQLVILFSDFQKCQITDQNEDSTEKPESSQVSRLGASKSSTIKNSSPTSLSWLTDEWVMARINNVSKTMWPEPCPRLPNSAVNSPHMADWIAAHKKDLQNKANADPTGKLVGRTNEFLAEELIRSLCLNARDEFGKKSKRQPGSS